MIRLGIFGGTFDPPHLAHLILADEACDQMHLTKVLWVLTPYPPHKEGKPITPWLHRLEMLKRAISDNNSFELCSVDIDRPPPHYAVDTMNILKQQYPGAKLFYLMGGDSLSQLPTWERPHEFIQVCNALVVMHRSNDHIGFDTLEHILPGIKQKTIFIKAPLVEISGADIRRRVAERKPFRYYLPDSVYRLILEQNLYRGSN